MPKTKNLNEAELHIPQLVIPYKYVDITGINVTPTMIDEGLFRLKTRERRDFDKRKKLLVHTGIHLKLPRYVDISERPKKSSFDENPIFFKAVLRANITSYFDLMHERGLQVLGPTVLSPTYTGELVLLMTNIGNGITTIYPGDEIAELYFSISPISMLGLQQYTNMEN